MKKDNTVIYVLYLIASFGFFVAAALNIFGSNPVTGVIFMALGASFLCLTFGYMLQEKDKDKNKK